jgi:hypothetical protein
MTERTVADEGFLRRWARRKAENRTAEPLADDAPHAAAPLPGTSGAAASGPAAAALNPLPHGAGKEAAPAGVPSATGRPSPAVAPPPTLDDAARLTADSDFSAFVARGVDATVRRTALKKLFADPHFNVMDGLDIYIGDYTQPSPVSEAMLASLAHARQVLRRTVDAGEDADGDAAPEAATHVQRQQSPEPGHDEHPPDRHADDA